MQQQTGTTRVTYRRNPGFFERLGKSCSGVFIGFCLFIFSFIILYFNEGNSVETAQMLEDGLHQVVPFSSLRSSTNEQLVHHTGILHTNEEVFDPIFGVHVRCAKLHRKVEMYQWVEYSSTKEIDEGERTRQETTYSYSTEWRSRIEFSRNFAEEVGHRNPTEMDFKEEKFEAPVVSVDKVRLSAHLLSKIDWFKLIYNLPQAKEGLKALIHRQYYYLGRDPSFPQIGDLRVWFECGGISETSDIGLVDSVSVIAQLNGDVFGPFQASNGRSIELLYKGIKSAREMFDSEHASNNARTWFLRVFGAVLMYIGLSIMSQVVVTMVDWIPIIRGIVSMSVTIFNLSLASFLSLGVIAISWLRFRPVFAASLFALSVVPWYFSHQRARSAYYAR